MNNNINDLNPVNQFQQDVLRTSRPQVNDMAICKTASGRYAFRAVFLSPDVDHGRELVRRELALENLTFARQLPKASSKRDGFRTLPLLLRLQAAFLVMMPPYLIKMHWAVRFPARSGIRE